MVRKEARQLIIDTLKDKSSMKQDVYERTLEVFEDLKVALNEIGADLRKNVATADSRIVIEDRVTDDFQAELKFAGDILFFQMHTNIFYFETSHSIWKTSYVNEDNHRAFCGMINIYNFLSDSFKYQRINDTGYLVARIFINKELHFFVEGKRQLGFLYNDFVNSVMDKKTLRSILESAILYTLDFELLTPPYDNMKEVKVHELMEIKNNMKIQTGKRLGFRFQADSDSIDMQKNES